MIKLYIEFYDNDVRNLKPPVLSMDLKIFANHQLKLLNIERREEARIDSLKQNYHKGTIDKLILNNKYIGEKGRLYLEFGKENKTCLPFSTIAQGDAVELINKLSKMEKAKLAKKKTSGVKCRVYSIDPDSIILSCNPFMIKELRMLLNANIEVKSTINNILYSIHLIHDDITYQRMEKALESLAYFKNITYPSQQIIQFAFNPNKVIPIKNINVSLYPIFFNDSLDDGQKSAICYAHEMIRPNSLLPPLTIIHGCPGSGKTTVLIELILHAILNLNLKVLVCAPSNIAVDNVGERLLDFVEAFQSQENKVQNRGIDVEKIKIVRLGNVSKTSKRLLKYTVAAHLAQSLDFELITELRNELKKSILKTDYMKGTEEGNNPKAEVHIDFGAKRALKTYEDRSLGLALKSSNLVLSTLVGFGAYLPTDSSKKSGLVHIPGDRPFDLLIIDECSQAFEAACWIPLLGVPKCVLAGDHLQLPPTIFSKEAAEQGLEISLMERIVREYAAHNLDQNASFVRKLMTQYRMNRILADFVSEKLYQSAITAPSHVSDITLADLIEPEKGGAHGTEPREICFAWEPIVLVDSSGVEHEDLLSGESGNKSKSNLVEVELVLRHLERLVAYPSITPSIIGVISPYSSQIELLRQKIWPKYPECEINSVDGFQGREKEIIILSLVRSNRAGEVGFLGDVRRMNVALTRAKRHLCVICDTRTVGKDPFIKSLMAYVKSCGQSLDPLTGISIPGAHSNSKEHPRDFKSKSVKANKEESQNAETTPNKCAIPTPTLNDHANKKLTITGAKHFLQNLRHIVVKKIAAQIEEFLPLRNVCEILEELEHVMPAQELPFQITKGSLSIISASSEERKGNYKITFRFPPSLNAYERSQFHEAARLLGDISHQSVGDDLERFLEISFTCINASPKVERNRITEAFKELSLEDNSETASSKESETVPTPTPRKTPKLKKKEVLDKESVEEDSNIVEKSKWATYCAAPQGCRQKISLFGQTCPLKCNSNVKFCLKHCTPEAHSCALLIGGKKFGEIREIEKSFKEIAHFGSGKAVVRRNLLRRELGKKIKEKEGQRSNKKT